MVPSAKNINSNYLIFCQTIKDCKSGCIVVNITIIAIHTKHRNQGNMGDDNGNEPYGQYGQWQRQSRLTEYWMVHRAVTLPVLACPCVSGTMGSIFPVIRKNDRRNSGGMLRQKVTKNVLKS